MIFSPVLLSGPAWIVDIGTTIKPLYGKQECVQASYNPHKPGRRSHALHMYWTGNLRLALDVAWDGFWGPFSRPFREKTEALGGIRGTLAPNVACHGGRFESNRACQFF